MAGHFFCKLFSALCALQSLAIFGCTLIEKAFPIALRVAHARALFPAERPTMVFCACAVAEVRRTGVGLFCGLRRGCWIRILLVV